MTGKKLFECPDELIQKTMEVNTHAPLFVSLFIFIDLFIIYFVAIENNERIIEYSGPDLRLFLGVSPPFSLSGMACIHTNQRIYSRSL